MDRVLVFETRNSGSNPDMPTIFMKYLYLFIPIVFLLVGCKATTQSNKTVTTSDGYVYKFVKKGKIITNNQKEVDTWERVTPPDVGNWYFPSLQSASDTNVPITFFSTPRQ
jgi:hypothetical protein